MKNRLVAHCTQRLYPAVSCSRSYLIGLTKAGKRRWISTVYYGGVLHSPRRSLVLSCLVLPHTQERSTIFPLCLCFPSSLSIFSIYLPGQPLFLLRPRRQWPFCDWLTRSCIAWLTVYYYAYAFARNESNYKTSVHTLMLECVSLITSVYMREIDVHTYDSETPLFRS